MLKYITLKTHGEMKIKLYAFLQGKGKVKLPVLIFFQISTTPWRRIGGLEV